MSRSKRLKQYHRDRYRNRDRIQYRGGFSPPDFDCDPDTDPDRLGDTGLAIWGSRQTCRKSAAKISWIYHIFTASRQSRGISQRH